MDKIDEKQIELGRKLNDLLRDDNFAPLLEEIDKRVLDLSDRILTFRNGSMVEPIILPDLLARYQELKDLRGWISDQIKYGSDELNRKESLTKKSDAKVELKYAGDGG